MERNIPITGVGRAEVRVAGGLLPCDDYLICPDAQQFLLSVAKICDLDLNVLFTKLGGRIVSTDGAVFATLTRMGNLYSLDTVVTGFPDDVPCATALPYEIAASLSYAGVDMATWHSRFCHINTLSSSSSSTTTSVMVLSCALQGPLTSAMDAQEERREKVLSTRCARVLLTKSLFLQSPLFVFSSTAVARLGQSRFGATSTLPCS